VNAQSIEGFCERCVCGVFLFLSLFLSERGGGNQAERGKSNWRLPLLLVQDTGEILTDLVTGPVLYTGAGDG
jgi:hypothetical protein